MTLLGAIPGAARASPSIEPVDKRIQLDEGADEQVITDLCKLPAVDVELRTRSNMLSSDEVDALRHCRHPRILLRPPFLPAHVERLERVPRAEPILELTASQTPVWLDLAKLGPRRWHVEVAGELTEDRARALAELRNADVEIDLRGRVPGADELSRLNRLDHVSHTLLIGADAPPELIAALRLVRPTEVVVETHGNQVPRPLLTALAASEIPVRLVVTWPVVARDLEALGEVSRLSLEVKLGAPQRIPRGFISAFAPLDPDLSPPVIDGGHSLTIPVLPR